MSAMNRRNFITGSFAVGAASVLPAHAAEKKLLGMKKRMLL